MLNFGELDPCQDHLCRRFRYGRHRWGWTGPLSSHPSQSQHHADQNPETDEEPSFKPWGEVPGCHRTPCPFPPSGLKVTSRKLFPSALRLQDQFAQFTAGSAPTLSSSSVVGMGKHVRAGPGDRNGQANAAHDRDIDQIVPHITDFPFPQTRFAAKSRRRDVVRSGSFRGPMRGTGSSRSVWPLREWTAARSSGPRG